MTALLAPVMAQAVNVLPAKAAIVDLDQTTFAAFLDVLLPRDPQSPSASELGVPAELIEIAKTVEPFYRLITLACTWMNDTGSAPFHALPEADKLKLVTWMSTSDFNQIPRRFFHLVRLSAVEIYYAPPGAIRGYPLNNAPQPEGYPPPWL